jgi:hypothetical protein
MHPSRQIKKLATVLGRTPPNGSGAFSAVVTVQVPLNVPPGDQKQEGEDAQRGRRLMERIANGIRRLGPRPRVPPLARIAFGMRYSRETYCPPQTLSGRDPAEVGNFGLLSIYPSANREITFASEVKYENSPQFCNGAHCDGLRRRFTLQLQP